MTEAALHAKIISELKKIELDSCPMRFWMESHVPWLFLPSTSQCAAVLATILEASDHHVCSSIHVWQQQKKNRKTKAAETQRFRMKHRM